MHTLFPVAASPSEGEALRNWVVRERAAWNMFDIDVLAWHLDAGINKRFLRDLADIRLAVEPSAARLAAERRSETNIAELRRSIALMQAAPSDSAGFAELPGAIQRVDNPHAPAGESRLVVDGFLGENDVVGVPLVEGGRDENMGAPVALSPKPGGVLAISGGAGADL